MLPFGMCASYLGGVTYTTPECIKLFWLPMLVTWVELPVYIFLYLLLVVTCVKLPVPGYISSVFYI